MYINIINLRDHTKKRVFIDFKKITEMAQNSQKWQRNFKNYKLNCQKWPKLLKMYGNCWKWLKVTVHEYELLDMASNS